MLGRIGRLCADSVILKRIIPLLLVALEDSFALIKVTALRTLTVLCSLVEEFEPIEVNFFPQYLFPNISRVCRDPEPIVRIAFAECMGVLALTAKSFLDRGHSIFLNKAISTAIANNLDINKVTVEFPYDQKLELLKDQVARWIRDLVVEGNVIATKTKNSFASESAVKKVLLQHIMELCVFFGQESTMEKLLTHVLTFPNDQVFLCFLVLFHYFSDNSFC
jgi:phosphoinositide-3-kinase regulatory subunit 4